MLLRTQLRTTASRVHTLGNSVLSQAVCSFVAQQRGCVTTCAPAAAAAIAPGCNHGSMPRLVAAAARRAVPSAAADPGDDVSRLKAALRAAASASSRGTQLHVHKPGPDAPRLLGLFVPEIRAVVRSAVHVPSEHLLPLLHSEMHEERLAALMTWAEQYRKLPAQQQRALVALYLRELEWVNQWDSVDCSAPYLLGAALHTAQKDGDAAYHAELVTTCRALLSSVDWWRRRVPIVATLTLVRAGDTRLALEWCTALVA
ncbi:MAG: hypothetical protein EOO41_05105, partial [Methanobacteriota archaeon]